VFTGNFVTNMGDNAFGNCSSLTSLSLGNALTNQKGSQASTRCNNLKRTTIPSSVTSLGGQAFYYCSGLTNVIVSATNIGPRAFESCSGLTSLTLGSGVASNGQWAFVNCCRLPSLTLPNSVISIGDYAFNLGDPQQRHQRWGVGFLRVPRADQPRHRLWDDQPWGVTFGYCSNLSRVFFRGNVPGQYSGAFTGTPATTYYLPGTTGWGTYYGGRPTVLWNPAPQTTGPNFGVGPNGFGFNLTGTTNIPIVVEATAGLGSGSWTLLLSCTLTNGLVYFSDPAWTNYPTRFYRIRSP
jgi:hypothetical protein